MAATMQRRSTYKRQGGRAGQWQGCVVIQQPQEHVKLQRLPSSPAALAAQTSLLRNAVQLLLAQRAIKGARQGDPAEAGVHPGLVAAHAAQVVLAWGPGKGVQCQGEKWAQ